LPNPTEDRLKIERVGGLAGFSLPGSHIKSGGELALSKLSPVDLKALDALFHGGATAGAPKPDGFVYRITRTIGNALKTIEVPEDHVPMVIRNAVKNTLE
jgi:hypothetical protein